MPSSKIIHLKKGRLAFSLLDNNHTESILFDNLRINQFRANDVFGGISDIFLRFRDEELAFSLRDSAEHVASGDDYHEILGHCHGVAYRLCLYLTSENLWFFRLSLSGCADNLDVVYVQDIALGNKNVVLSNELYLSQYLDHRILRGPNGINICSRQNMGSPNPLLAQGSIDIRVERYATDAMQWLSPTYKLTGKPALLHRDLPNINYQYELATIALQSERFSLRGEKTFGFYGFLINNQEKPIDDLSFYSDIRKQYDQIPTAFPSEKGQISVSLNQNISKKPFICRNLTKEELHRIFGKQLFPEVIDGRLVSFFREDYSHVVLREKEVLLERPSGNIITSLNISDKLDKNLLTSTNYSYGLFNAQVVAGNTSMNKFLSANRGLLNTTKLNGQRIFIKINDVYQMLGVPSAYEMGLNYSIWYYAFEKEIISVKAFMSAEHNQINMHISSLSGRLYEYIISNQIVMGEHEYTNDFKCEKTTNGLTFRPAANSFQTSKYPDLIYQITVFNNTWEVDSDRLFFTDNQGRDPSLVLLRIAPTSVIELSIQGTIVTEDLRNGKLDNFTIEKDKYINYYANLLNGFRVSLENKQLADRINLSALWFAQNAMIHYAVPHGLEQTGGAAWGTRDVCQGPLVFFLATRNYALARDALLIVFSNQFKDRGEWPQWFFFDNYGFAADGCHGDVVFWPLKALGDYIKASGDLSILDELTPYHLDVKEEPLLDHVKIALAAIEKRLIKPFDLVSYAGGDWDDTLQPAKKNMEMQLVSTWTQALAYQTCSSLAQALKGIDKTVDSEVVALFKRIKGGFEKHCIKDGVLAGFVYIEKDGTLKYMLHPSDKDSGIHFRLLPLTRSIISELASKEESKAFDNIIDEKLTFADGVRLMDAPASYNGGVSRLFVRAEQASNVGREISLLYIHAHIRYIEAMAKLGNGEKAFQNLLKVLPVDIKSVAPNSLPRQANSYFSSSDGLFMDRYEYHRDFNKLKDGSVPVRGGWRVYSSGPGIFLKVLISDFFGIRFEGESLIIDPTINKSFDGLEFTYKVNNQDIVFAYHIESPANPRIIVYSDQTEIKGEEIKNPYRSGGIKIPLSVIGPNTRRLDIFIK